MGVDEFELRLFRVAPEGETRLQTLELLDTGAKVAAPEARLGALVEDVLGGVVLLVVFVVVADEGHPGATGQERQQGRAGGQPEHREGTAPARFEEGAHDRSVPAARGGFDRGALW